MKCPVLLVTASLALIVFPVLATAFLMGGGKASSQIYSQINTLDSINGSVVNAYGTWTFGRCVNDKTGAGPPGPWGCFAYTRLNGKPINRFADAGGFSSQIVVQNGEVTLLQGQNDRFQYGFHNYDGYPAACPDPNPTLPCPTPGEQPNYHPPYTPSSDGSFLTSTPGILVTDDGEWKNGSSGGALFLPILNGIYFTPSQGSDGYQYSELRINCGGNIFGHNADNGKWYYLRNFSRFEVGPSGPPACPVVVDVNVTPNPALVIGTNPNPQVPIGSPVGTVIASFAITTSDGSPYTGSIILGGQSWMGISGSNVVTTGPVTTSCQCFFSVFAAFSSGLTYGPGENMVNVKVP